MIKVAAIKNGKEIKIATVQDKEGQDTLSIEQALINAHEMFDADGLDYDDVQVEFIYTNVSIMGLMILFITPCDAELVEQERMNEAKAAIVAAQVKASRTV